MQNPRLMKRFMLPLLLPLLAVYANAQTSGSAPGTDRPSIASLLEKRARLHEGMPIGEFIAYTPDGEVLTEKSLSGKVTLLLFWYPTTSSSRDTLKADYLQFSQLPALRKQYRDFRIISLLADTSLLAVYRVQNPVANEYPVATLQSHSKASALNTGMGMPSCMLVDRYGVVVKKAMLNLSLFNEQAMVDKVKETELR